METSSKTSSKLLLLNIHKLRNFMYISIISIHLFILQLLRALTCLNNFAHLLVERK